VKLTWSPSTGIGGVAKYYVRAGTSPSAMTVVAAPTTTSYTYQQGSPGTTYYFAVESVNPLGISSAASAAVSAKTKAE
jgi:hypothetical protein